MSEWIPMLGCLLVGTWSALDGSAVGQFLVSRPLVAATLAGWFLGDPGAGALFGLLLEGVYLGGVPAGGARLPEPGPAAVAGVFAYTSLSGPGGLALGLALAVTLAALGGLTVSGQRMVNGALTRTVATGTPPRRGLARAHWLCIGLDGIRGLALTACGLLLGSAVPSELARGWPLGAAESLVLFAVPSAVTIGGVLREWARTPLRGALFVAACVGGLTLAVVI